MFLLSVPQALRLYRIEGLHSMVLTVTAAVLREMITEGVYIRISSQF